MPSLSPLDHDHCAQEAIATPGTVQPFGGMLVVDRAEGTVIGLTGGVSRLLGQTIEVGQSISELLPSLDWDGAREPAVPPGSPLRQRVVTPGQAGLDLLIHPEADGQRVIIEILPAESLNASSQEEALLYQSMTRAIEALARSTDLESFWTHTTQLLQEVLGYDRVMVYRFEPDHSGTVLAEATASGVTSRFLHLRFPESDIPAQARALYTRNLVRVIADIDATPDPVIGLDGPPLDQSYCLLRQPSGMHLRYLRNMGVKATLTVSLLHEGRLWGLLACHHSEARVPPHHLHRGLLVVSQLMGAAFNSRLDVLLKLEQARAEAALMEDLATFNRQLLTAPTDTACLALIQGLLARHTPVTQCRFTAPCPAGCQREVGELAFSEESASMCLPLWPGQPLQCLRLERIPEATTIAWGGNPHDHEPLIQGEGQVVLGPRRSFSLWLETTSRRQTVWQEDERSQLTRLCEAIGRACLARMTHRQASRLQLLGAALDQSHDMVIVTEAAPSALTGRRPIIYVNQALLHHSGYTADEMMGQSPSMLQGPETDPLVIKRMSERLAQHLPVNEHLVNYRKDGAAYITELRITPFSDDQGSITHFLSVQRDISEQVALSQALAQKNTFLETLTEQLPAAVYVFLRQANGHYAFEFATSLFYKLLGFHADIPTVSGVLQAIHPEDMQEVVDSIERAHLTASRWRQRFRVTDSQTLEARTLEGRSFPVFEPNGDSRWYGLLLDVTDQVEMEMALNEAVRDQEATLSAVPEKLLELDADGTLLNAHIRGETLLGLDVGMVLHQRLSDHFKGHIAQTFTRALAEAAQSGTSNRHELHFVHDGHKQYRNLKMVRKDRSLPGNGKPLPPTFIASVTDITRFKQAEKRIRFLVEHDELTHLLNRRGFQDRLNQAHAMTRENGQSYALIFVDLDHFKHLNDSHGHRAGDAALREVAGRIRQVVGVGDVLARLGGDEFVILMVREDRATTHQDAMTLAHDLHLSIQRPLRLDDMAFTLTCSIGIAVADTDAGDSDEILRWADLAMYSVKEDGRNAIRFFSEEVHQGILERIRLEQSLRHALERQELQMYAQPIVNAGQQTVGMECLLRWHTADGRWVSPVDFIPIAEQSGLINPIGLWTLEQACQQLQAWTQQLERSRYFLAVNVSHAQIKRPDFVAQVATLLERYTIPKGRLKLEMTESLLQDDIEGTIEKLRQLRALGVTISLDDFGTGYSSLSYLLKLPIDELKMDRSFLLNALDQPQSAHLARLIIQTAQALGLDVIAEGVETEEQHRFLQDLGCERFQGYLFGRPAPLG